MVSLQEVNEEADRQYGGMFVVSDVEGGDVLCRPVLRLPKNERHRAGELVKELKDKSPDEDRTDKVLDVAAEFFRLVAVGDGGDRLLKAIDDDPAKLMVLFRMYREAMQLGEASTSES